MNRNRLLQMIAVFLLITSCQRGSGDSLVDEYGILLPEVSDKYFATLKDREIAESSYSENDVLPKPIEKILVSFLPAEKYADYLQNIYVGNYYLYQYENEENIYSIHIPRTENTPEGQLLWKVGLDFLFQVRDDQIVGLQTFHQVAKMKLKQNGKFYEYVSVDSSFGMNSTEISLFVFGENGFSTPVLQKTVYMSGSAIDSIMLYWDWNEKGILFNGFQWNSVSKKMVPVRQQVELR